MEKKPVQHHVHLDATAKLLTGDLQAAAARASWDNHLEKWIQDLKDANLNQHLHELIVTLQDLKAHLGSGDHDPSLIARLLRRMARLTMTVAPLAEDETQAYLHRLVAALDEAAVQVEGGEAAPEEDLQRDSAGNR